MTLRLSITLFCMTLILSACSPRDSLENEEAEWADVQLTTNGAAELQEEPRQIVQSAGENYAPLIRRLEEMKTVRRGEGETMITGTSLVFNYDRRFVRMDENVRVEDDYGELKAETLMGRFSEDNRVEMVEAGREVRISSEGREAAADKAVYVLEDGAIQLDGNAQVYGDGNRLSGDQIRFWTKGSRKMICGPNAMLEVSGASDLVPGGVADDAENTVIRSERIEYNQDEALVVFDGNVRIFDRRARMNSDKVLLHLKENDKIDWIEALSGVIIQSDDRKALADRAIYYADEGKFILEGEPKVMDGPNVMTGDRISFWHESERMVCEPNARVLLYPDEEMKAKFLQDLKDDNGS